MSDRGACNIIIPNLLYQRRQFITWPYERKRDMLDELEIKTIINLWHKVDAELSLPGRVYLHWPCSTAHLQNDVGEMVQWGLQRLRRGPVLVHCEAGKGRSAWLSARLLSAYAGIPRAEALRRVRAAVPTENIHPALLKDLE